MPPRQSSIRKNSSTRWHVPIPRPLALLLLADEQKTHVVLLSWAAADCPGDPPDECKLGEFICVVYVWGRFIWLLCGAPRMPTISPQVKGTTQLSEELLLLACCCRKLDLLVSFLSSPFLLSFFLSSYLSSILEVREVWYAPRRGSYS